MTATRIAVIGAGSWGTALANLLADNGHNVCLWAHEAELVARMTRDLVNDLYLPAIPLNPALHFSADLAQAVGGCPVVLMVPPSQVMRQLASQLRPHLAAEATVISASKGIENDSLMLMSQVLAEVLAERTPRLADLSGPSFAREVAQGMPTAVVAASSDPATAELVQQLFSNRFFRVYTDGDTIGVELAGALKNVIALAAGIAEGLGFGNNTRAALITRGLAEITRLGVTLGAEPATFAGLAGMGDLVLTCTGALSRNRTVGLELGQGRSLQDILQGMTMVAEGVKTTLSAYQLAGKLGVEMPITTQAYRILYEGKDCRTAVGELMLRDPRPERDL